MLRQTNRNLHNLISTKDAWAAVLKRVCDEHMLFAPSYPLNSMDLSQIKYAALGPYRWSNAIPQSKRMPAPTPTLERFRRLGLTPRHPNGTRSDAIDIDGREIAVTPRSPAPTLPTLERLRRSVITLPLHPSSTRNMFLVPGGR